MTYTFKTGNGETVAVGTTSSATVRVSDDDHLLREINYLRSQINKLTVLIDDKENIIRQLQMTSNFTDAEISFILMRCHPDRNPDSKIAHGLTQKLLDKRKKT